MTRLRKVSEDEYDIQDKGEDNFHWIELIGTSPYIGVVFQFGRVQLLEEDERLRVKFEYEVFDNPNNFNTNTQDFRDYIGQILMTNLEELLFYNQYQRGGKRD